MKPPPYTPMPDPPTRPPLVPPEVPDLGLAIHRLSDGVTRLMGTGLNRKAIVVLLHHQTKVPIKVIETVLNGLAQLKAQYAK